MATFGFKAKPEVIHDDLDEFDFGNMGFDVEDPPDDRHPAMKVLSPVGAGIKDYVTDSRNIERFVKQAMPPGYGQAINKIGETTDDLRQLYNGIQNELRPVKETSKRVLKKILPKIDGKISKGLQRKLEEMAKEEERYQGRQGDDKESQMANMLTTIFEQQQLSKAESRTDADEREKVKQGFEQIRHRSEMGQLDAIRTGIESLTQYQNKITYNVQKKQLELSYRQFWAMADLSTEQKRSNAEMLAELKATRKNTALPDFVKQTTHERFKELARNKFLENVREGMFGGAGDYIKRFTKNISEQVLGRVRDYSNTISGVGDMASGMSDMAGDMPGLNMRDEAIRMGMSLPMDWLANRGAKAANKYLGKSSKLRRDSMKRSYQVNTAGDRLHNTLTNPVNNWGGLEFLREMLANAAPTSAPESKMEVDNLNRYHEPKPFNRANSKSLDEVIPGLLARIHREIKILRTGDEKTELITYDFTKNKFSTEKKVSSDLRQYIAGSGSERANRYSNQIISKINRGGNLTPEQLEKARKQLIEKSVMGESLDITRINEGQHWGGGEDGDAIAMAFNKYLRAQGGNLGDNYKSHDRQIKLLQDHRSIVSGLGDPRVLIQQLVNAGQLEGLKASGILDANNNLDRKVFAEWLANKEADEAPNVPQPNGPGNKKLKFPKKKTTPTPPNPNKLNFNQLRQNQPQVDMTEVVNELKVISEKLGNKPPPGASTVESNVQTITELLQSINTKYSQEAEITNAMLMHIYMKMGSGGGGGGSGGGDPDAGPGGGNGPKQYDSLYEHIKDKGSESLTKLMAAGRKHGRRAMRRGSIYANIANTKATEAFYKVKEIAGRKLSDAKNRLSNVRGDIFMPGETKARLRQALLDAGVYRDKITGNVITNLADIKGDVVDAAGNTVITLEEFYQSYVGGDIRKKVSELFKGLKDKVFSVVDQAKEFIPAKLQQLKQFGGKVIKKLKDSMPPFDVYVKSDMTKPVMYASLMKFDGYFSKKTMKPIRHPSHIDGEVLDSRGNIVVNEDQIKDGLVDVAGVPVGNELTRLAGRALQYAGMGFQALRTAGKAAWAGLGKGMTGVKDYLKDFTVPLSEIIVNSKKTVTLLEKIHTLLDERLPGKKVKGDLTGDGIRDGSIEDIHLKKEAAEKAKSAKEAAKAAERGSASTGGALGKLLDFFKKKKGGEEGEEGEGGGKGILGMLGLDGIFGEDDGGGDGGGNEPREDNRTDKEKRRDKAKERLKRMKKSARARQAAAARARFGAGARSRFSNLSNRIGGSRLGRSGFGRRAGMMGRGIGNLVNNRATRGVGRGIWGTTKWLGRGALGAGRMVTGPGRMGRFIRGGMWNPSGVMAAGRGLMAGGRGLGALGSAALPFIGKAGAIGTALYGANEARKTLFDKTKDTDEKIESLTDTGVSMAGGIAGAKAGALAGAAAGSFVPLVGNAIGGILGGIIGGGLGYWGAGALNEKRKGFGAWWNKAKFSNLSKLRLAQYGVSDEDKDAMDKVFLLESTLEPHMTLKEDGNLVLDEKKIKLDKIAQSFGINTQEDMQLFNQWYKSRFIPVYRKWITVVRKIKPDGKLSDVETIIPAKDKLKVAEESVSSLRDIFDNTVGWNRAHLKLTYNAAGVQQVMDDLRITLQKEAESAGGAAAVATAKASTVSSTKDANLLAQKALTDKATYLTKDKDGAIIDPASMSVGDLTDKIKKGEVTVEVAVALPKNLLHTDPSQLDALTTIRFKAYGLTALVADKARMLGALEDYLADNINTDGDQPKLTISTDQILKAAGDVFGVPNGNGEHARRWRGWFNGRFLPVYLIYVGALRKKTGKKNLKDALMVYPMTEQAGLARAIIGAQGRGEMGNVTSVWNVTFNPWSGTYEMNTNPDSTAGNMEAIRLVADKVKLGEVTAKDGKVQETGKANQQKGFWGKSMDKVKNFFGVDTKPKGEGVRATGDTLVKNATPISGMGDPVSMSGGGGGNYLDLPKPTGVGWAANRDMIIKAALMAGVDPKALITTIAVESSFDPNAAPKGTNLASSAKGLGQHLDESWMEDLQRDGKKFGIPNGTNQFDARASALMTASRLKFNGQQLAKNLGRPVTTTDLYLAHLMGLGGATKFLKSPGDAIGAEVGGAAAKQHPNYFYDKSGKALTVKEVYAGFTAKLSKRPAELGVDQDSMKSSVSPSAPASASSSTAAPSAASQGTNVPPASSAQAPAPSDNGGKTKSPPANFANTPAAGTPQLNGPIEMDKGKSATMGNGPAMVAAKGVVYELILQREDSEDDGMYGTLRFPDGTVLNTLELPWRDNAPRTSSIPPGTYPCKTRSTTNFGESYELQNVPGRSAILIHAGNSAGSADKGMKADSQGCILLGMDRGRKGNQKVITASKAAMKLFAEKMGGQPFKLTIRPGKNNTATDTTGKGISFDPVRAAAGTQPPEIKATAMPKASFTPAASTEPETKPTALPRLNPTMTSFNPGSPSKSEMERRDQAMSEVIAPKLDNFAKLLEAGNKSTSGSHEVLLKIYDFLKSKDSGASKDESTVPAGNGKIKPITNTDVPIPQRRKY